jgi:hypothetical protein
VATTVATTADVDTIAARHADLKSADLLPDQHLVDAGYLGVDHVLEARADQGVKLIGPLPPDSGWQARDQDGLDSAGSVSIGTASRSPAQRQDQPQPAPKPQPPGLSIVQVSFRAADRTPCPDRAGCTRSPTLARGLTFRPHVQYKAQRLLRAEQATLAGGRATPTAPASRAPSPRPPTAATFTRPATAGWQRPIHSTC